MYSTFAAHMKGNISSFLSELAGGIIFSLFYFVVLSRLQSDEYSINLLQFTGLVSLIYLVSVFLTSYDYRADIIPVVSILRCFLESSLKPLYINVAAQLVGNTLGFLLYLLIQSLIFTKTNIAEIEYGVFALDNKIIRGMLYVAMLGVLCYWYFIIRYAFSLTRLTGIFLISLIVYVILSLTYTITILSVVNPYPDILLSVKDMVEGKTPFFSVNEVALYLVCSLIAIFIVWIKVKDVYSTNISKNSSVDRDFSIFPGDYDF